MKIKGAMTVLNKRSDYFGKSFDWLIENMDNGNHIGQPHKVLVAYEVYKMSQGWHWKGTEFDTWVKADANV